MTGYPSMSHREALLQFQGRTKFHIPQRELVPAGLGKKAALLKKGSDLVVQRPQNPLYNVVWKGGCGSQGKLFGPPFNKTKEGTTPSHSASRPDSLPPVCMGASEMTSWAAEHTLLVDVVA